jgi:hypothetical protein
MLIHASEKYYRIDETNISNLIILSTTRINSNIAILRRINNYTGI